MRVTELKALAGDRELRNYSWVRKAELVALLQNNPLPSRSGGSAPRARPLRPTRPPPPPQRRPAPAPWISSAGASAQGVLLGNL